ncbi:putative condensin-2 complex subunit H2 [Blattamonas nauphoetae]|uniref:Condensin-2 complex subunit H2 n=1 Tax=Blattamonas nauphoetae TaxID=2049346 RepID=A0ABQ9X296_9EUKA|nr:putative condensin-2 complex subunit H2 [Blattamonas nauphoetae]
MSQNTLSKYADLIQPVKNLADNWNINILEELTTFINDLNQIEFNLDGNITSFSFIDAALVIQNSVAVFGRKVDYLANLVYNTLENLITSGSGLFPTRKSADFNPDTNGDSDDEVGPNKKESGEKSSTRHRKHTQRWDLLHAPFELLDNYMKDSHKNELPEYSSFFDGTQTNDITQPSIADSTIFPTPNTFFSLNPPIDPSKLDQNGSQLEIQRSKRQWISNSYTHPNGAALLSSPSFYHKYKLSIVQTGSQNKPSSSPLHPSPPSAFLARPSPSSITRFHNYDDLGGSFPTTMETGLTVNGVAIDDDDSDDEGFVGDAIPQDSVVKRETLIAANEQAKEPVPKPIAAVANLIPKEIFETKPNPVNVVSTDCWATFDPADETGTTILLTTGEVIGEEDEEDADGEGSQKEKRQEATKKAKAPIKRPFKMMKQSVLRKLTASTPLKGPPLTANLMGSVLKTVTKPSNQSTEKRGSVISPEAFLNDKTASVIYEKERNEEGIFSTQSFSNQTDFIDFFATELVRVKTIEREEKTREAEEQRKKEIQNVEKEKRKTIMNALKEEEEAASPDEEPESITADLDVDSDDEQLDAELMAPPPTDEFDRIRTAIEERVKQESLQMPRKLDEEEDKDVVDFGFEANEFRNDAAFDTSYTQVSQFINESEAWRIQTNLSQRVGTWHKHVEAILQKEVRHSFIFQAFSEQ